MKKQINKSKILTSPLFGSQIFFIFGSPEYAEKVKNKKYSGLSDSNYKKYNGLLEVIECNKKAVVFILYINSIKWNYLINNYATLTHECFHLAMAIFRHANSVGADGDVVINYSDSEEYHAYLIDSLFSLILKQITKFMKYKK